MRGPPRCGFTWNWFIRKYSEINNLHRGRGDRTGKGAVQGWDFKPSLGECSFSSIPLGLKGRPPSPQRQGRLRCTTSHTSVTGYRLDLGTECPDTPCSPCTEARLAAAAWGHAFQKGSTKETGQREQSELWGDPGRGLTGVCAFADLYSHTHPGAHPPGPFQLIHSKTNRTYTLAFLDSVDFVSICKHKLINILI